MDAGGVLSVAARCRVGLLPLGQSDRQDCRHYLYMSMCVCGPAVAEKLIIIATRARDDQGPTVPDGDSPKNYRGNWLESTWDLAQ